MQAIKAYTQIFDDIHGDVNGKEILQKIETIARTCYKSEGKIKEGSAEKMVAGLIARGHEAMLEHGSFIFEVSETFYDESTQVISMLEQNYGFVSFLRFTHDTKPIISGNVRAWRSFFDVILEYNKGLPSCVENFIKENPIIFPEFQHADFDRGITTKKIKALKVTDLETENEKLTHWDVTVKFVVDRGISHEIVRHRVASFAQESTRYCNYGKDDFGKEITFIIPSYLDYKSAGWNTWKETMKGCEDAYFKLLDIGLLPQEARAVLPNSLKTEVVMTANLKEWKHFFMLRAANSTGAAHPQMLEMARPLLDEVKAMIPVVFDDITYNKGGENNGKK